MQSPTQNKKLIKMNTIMPGIALAIKTVATPCIIAVPSILIVAPKGTVNDAIFLFTPILSTTVLSVTGIVAFEDDVENANNIKDLILLKNLKGFTFTNKIKSKE